MKKIALLIMLLIFGIGINVYAKGFGVSPNNKGERPKGDFTDIVENNGKWIGDDTKNIYLTFDCGYENGYTKSILKTLENNNVKATFFITGHYLKSSREIVKTMIENGHIIGNHTLNHKDFTKSTNSEIIKEIKELEDVFYKEFNLPMSKYVRPPRGEYNETSMKVLNENGYKTVFWSLAYVDWHKDDFYGDNYSYKKIMSKIHNGAIILMHTVGKDNCVDLDIIIKGLKKLGYNFSSLDELYNDLSI